MDFFESQDRARRRSGRLILFYLIAVALIVIAVYFVVLFAGDLAGMTPERVHPIWDPLLFGGAAAVTIGIIGLGSGYRILQLRSGGSRVAEMMGGRRVDSGTHDPDERRLVNVVEEMAIASGVPVPEIFVMDREESINAFAAGYSPSDAAVAVTAGTLRTLNRDELQGVIAHEFSHILNGDMRLNIRLIGVLNGILVLHLIGLILVRSLAFSRGTTSRSRRDGSGGGAAVLAFVVVGVSLIIIGYIGVLFSRMIQAAVSRQREFLADAAAVQFTRNPNGIGNALKKIGGAGLGSRIRDAHATEASHLFFANGLSSFSNLFATHPPLTERIRAIDPSFDGKSWIRPAPAPKAAADSKPRKERSKTPFGPLAETLPVDSAALLATIGTIGSGQIERAGAILETVPEALSQAAHDPAGAEAAVYALLVSAEGDLREKQLKLVSQRAGPEILTKLKRLLPHAESLPPEARLPLVDLALPALRQRPESGFRAFRETVHELSASDNAFSIFEFALEKVLLRHLERHFAERKRPPVVQYYGAAGLTAEISVLLSALAHCGDADPSRALRLAETHLRGVSLQLIPADACGFEELNAALDRLNLVSFPVKKQLLSAAIAVIAADGKLAPAEGELLRAIADSLDCPMPPLVQAAASRSSRPA